MYGESHLKIFDLMSETRQDKATDAKEHPISDVERMLGSKCFTDKMLNKDLGLTTTKGIKFRHQKDHDSYIVLISNELRPLDDSMDQILHLLRMNDAAGSRSNNKNQYVNFATDDLNVVLYFASENKPDNKRLNEIVEEKSHYPIFLMTKKAEAVDSDVPLLSLHSKMRIIDKPLTIRNDRTGTTYDLYVLMKEDDYKKAESENVLDHFRNEARESVDRINQGLNMSTSTRKDKTDMNRDFKQYLVDQRLRFSNELVDRFLCSIETRRFVILAGGSGCGKTCLAQAYAGFVSNGEPEHHTMVAVGSNWNESRHLIGYYNMLNGEYVHTTATQLLMKAKKHPNERFVLILDEMNLSTVEYYFSDFLSAMESREKIILGPSKPATEVSSDDLIDIGDNVCIIGTVNIDETTRMFSPKVLDRAFVIQFEETDVYEALGHPELKENNENTSNEDSRIQCPFNKTMRHLSLDECREVWKKKSAEIIDEMKSSGVSVDDLIRTLGRLGKTMNEIGLPFSHRTLDDIMRFVYISWLHDGCVQGWNCADFLDIAILEKILPKVHGGMEIRSALNALREKENQCLELPRCNRKLDSMEARLIRDRYVSFLE